MIGAAEKLLGEGVRNFALLFVVGEERNSAGAAVAARAPRGSKYLVNGEPTENKLALASKGILRFEIEAHGRMAHSAYPELGESAIEALLDALDAVRRMPLPHDPLLGPCTMNIGTISGGRAPNVIADAAKAEILVRLVGDPAPLREAFARLAGKRVQVKEILCIPAMRFRKCRWNADDGCILHHGCAGVRNQLGQAAVAGAGEHSRGAHGGRANIEAGFGGSCGNVCKCGKEVAGGGLEDDTLAHVCW